MKIQRRNKIVIADEESYWRQSSKDALASGGFEVRIVSRFTNLLFILEKEQPDLLILGFTRVGEEERQVICDVLNKYPNSPTVVLATILVADISRDLFRLGVLDVIDKPFATDELLGIVLEEMQQLERPQSAYREGTVGSFRNE